MRCLLLFLLLSGCVDELAEDEPPTFAGDECTDDCSGHEAGYAWAEERGISDPDECGGNSESFREGCVAFAEHREPDGGEREPSELY